MAQAVDRLALLVHHIVVFEQMFAGFEVLRFDGFLRCFDAARDQPRFDGNALFHAETLEQLGDPLLGENAHQVVFERKIKTRRTRIALASGATSKLIVDAASFVPLGAEDVQTPGGDDFVVLFVGLLLVAVESFGPLVDGNDVFVAGVIPDSALAVVNGSLNLALRGTQGLRDSLLHAFLLCHEFGVSAKQNIGSAARHVGGDRDHAFAAGLGNNLGFSFVLLGVQNPVLHTLFLQQFGKALGLFNRSGADQNRLASRVLSF